MGFYTRKSMDFGGVRFNFSKSGLGASTGFKGFRIGTGPKGSYVRMGQKGIHYHTAFFSPKGATEKEDNSSGVRNNFPAKSPAAQGGYGVREIESQDISLLVDSSSLDLISQINLNNKKVRLWPFSLILLAIDPIIGLAVTFLLYYFVDKRRKTTILHYDIDDATENFIQKFYDSFQQIIDCQAKWHISAEGAVENKKYNAGADNNVHRSRINIQFKTPKYLKTNVMIPCIPVGKQTLYFFPDRLLIYEKKKVGGLSYDNLDISQHNAKFIESSLIPQDAAIVDHTWQYTNKSGGPDKRFKDNKQLPVLLYSEIAFTSRIGLNERIQLSKANVGSELISQLEKYKSSGVLSPGSDDSRTNNEIAS